MNVLLGVIGNGRSELLSQTLKSLEDMVQFDWMDKVMIDDTGREDYAQYLRDMYDEDWRIISHSENQGLSGSVRSLWEYASSIGADYIFHVEEDFTFNEQIDINLMGQILKSDPVLAQLALKRQASIANPVELAAGGFMELDKHSYLHKQVLHRNKDSDDRIVSVDMYWYLRHRNFFTLNPSLYPIWVIDFDWRRGWGESEFSHLILANPKIYCGYLGHIDDPPKVHHIGDYRAAGWSV